VIGDLKSRRGWRSERQRLRSAFVVGQVAFRYRAGCCGGALRASAESGRDDRSGFDSNGSSWHPLDLSCCQLHRDQEATFCPAS
jgi:hypothetical protein